MIQRGAASRNKLIRLVRAAIKRAAVVMAILAGLCCVLLFEPLDLEEVPISGIAYERSFIGWRQTVLDTPYGPMPIEERFQPGDAVVIALRRGRWTRLARVSWAKSKAEYDFERALHDLRKVLDESRELIERAK